MDASVGTVIAGKIKDFVEQGIPEVFDRDLSLGCNPAASARQPGERGCGRAALW